MTSRAAAHRPSPNVILAVVAFGVFIAADDLTVVSTMLRQIVGDLGIALPDGFDQVAWIVNSYLVAYVAVMPFVGRLSDVIGRRKVYIGALCLFLIGSIWVPMASDLPMFVIGRVLTAIGGGAMVPVALAVIGDVFAAERRPRALGLLGAIDTIGWVWGPLFGALLVRFLDWRWQFYLNIPLAILGIIAAWWALRDLDRPTDRPARVDWAGAVTLGVGLVALNVALLNTNEISTVSSLEELTGGGSPSTVPFFGIAAIALGLFIFFELRAEDPLIDLSLFRRPNFAPGVLINFLVGAVLVIAMVDVPLFVNLVVETDLEKAAVLSGWVLSAMTATMALSSYLGGVATERWWYRPVTVAGLVAAGTAFFVMGLSWEADTVIRAMVWQLALLGFGIGLTFAPSNAAVVDAAPEDRLGTAAGLVILFRLMGLSVGLSGLTAWGLYRFNELRSTLELPPITDPGYADAVSEAQSTLTATALAETFLFAAFVVVAAIGVAMFLRRAPVAADAEGDATK